MEGKSIGGGIQLKGEGKRKKMEENSESGGKTYKWRHFDNIVKRK